MYPVLTLGVVSSVDIIAVLSCVLLLLLLLLLLRLEQGRWW